jgi:cell division transport system permease protein
MSLATYGARHVQALFGCLGRMLRAPLASLLTLLVIGLALALPATLWVFVSNARAATGDFAGAVELSVYFKPGTALAQVERLARNARSRNDVAEVTLIPAEQALNEFREFSGFGAALDALGENPLPHVLRIRPAPQAASASAVESLKAYFAAWPEVDLVQMDLEWVQRFNTMLQLMRRVLLIAGALLALGVLAVVGNTIRLEILNRRPEIEVTKLVGGSNAFVRRPFLYSGVLYGLGGALLAWGVLSLVITALEKPVSELAGLYGSQYALRGPAGAEIAAMLIAGLVLGWLGAWISAARHLRDFDAVA